MKQYLFFLFIVLVSSFQVFPQTALNQIDHNGEMQNVLVFENKTAEELYNYVKLWIADNYNNADKVTDADIKNSKIVVNGIAPGVVKMTGSSLGNQDLSYRSTFDFKENKIRITYSELKCPYPYKSYLYKNDGTLRTSKQATFVKESTTSYLFGEIESIKKTVEKENNDDW